MSDRKQYFEQYKARRKKLAWPKCKLCETIARRLPKLGCLECHARTMPRRRKWERLEADMVELYAGKDDIPHLQLRIWQETGSARSRNAIRAQTKLMGIKVAQHQDGYTIAQLSKLTGRPYHTIFNLVQRETIKNIGRGRRVLVSIEDGDNLIEWYRKDKYPSYSIEEVKRILGYDQSTVYDARKNGLPWWKEGHAVRICKVTIDRAVTYLRTTGEIRINWREFTQEKSA